MWIKRRQKGNEVYILCLSEGRKEKDHAIRQTHEQREQQESGGLALLNVGSQAEEMKTQYPFNRMILRAVLRKVSPMVIRVLAVPDYLDLASFDEVFRTLLGWDFGVRQN